MSLSCVEPEPADGPAVRRVEALAHPGPAGPSPMFADLTTFRVGGEIAHYVEAHSEDELIATAAAADHDGAPLLVLGGGSNLPASDAPFPATPVQNVGAYGQEVAETISSVRVWDRLERRPRMFSLGELRLGYRDSLLKRSLRDTGVGGGRLWGPTGRWVVLEVSFQLRLASLSAPIRYAELARTLGVEPGERAPSREVREAVIELRRSKGMVLDPEDHDTWSAGSFFTNPILTSEQAGALPDGAPRFPVADHTAIHQIGGAPVVVEGLVKTLSLIHISEPT